MQGSVDSYETKQEGKRWRIRWELPPDPDTGERRRGSRRGFPTRREAQRALREVLQAADAGLGAHAIRGKLAVADYLRQWLEGISVKPTTHADYWQCVEIYAIPRIGGIQLVDLLPEHLDRLYRDLEKRGKRKGKCRTAGVTCRKHGCRPEEHGGLAAATVRNVHGVIHKALQDAAERGYVPRNVASLAHPPRKKQARSRNPEIKCWTVEQLQTFLSHVREDRLYALYHLIAATGMRRGEAGGLRWSNVDLDARTLRITQTVTQVRGTIVRYQDAKTRSSERTIALDTRTVEVLREHRAEQDRERERLGEYYQDEGLLFAYEDGRVLPPKRVSLWFRNHCLAAGLPSIGVHGLRHTYATLALRAGVSPEVISARLGHADVTITLSIYAHVLDNDDADAAELVARTFLQ